MVYLTYLSYKLLIKTNYIMKQVFDRLRELFDIAEFESTRAIYLKNPVKVGENQNGDLLCTYITNNEYERNRFTVNVILNEKECDLYGKDYDFEHILFRDEHNGQPRFINGHHDDSTVAEDETITVNPTALTDILNELEETGNEWIKEQRELRVKERFYHRNAIYYADTRTGGQFAKHYKEETWEMRMERLQIRAEIGRLMWRRPTEKNPALNTLKEMKELGEEEYSKLQEERAEAMREAMKRFKSKQK